MPVTETFGAALRVARENAGYTREALAEKLGRTAQTVIAWESGISIPRPTTMTRLVALVGPIDGEIPADRVIASRAAQGLPPCVVDPTTLRRVADLVRGAGAHS